MFSSRFMLFPTLKKNGVKKKSGGGGGCLILSHFTFFVFLTFYAISNIYRKTI